MIIKRVGKEVEIPLIRELSGLVNFGKTIHTFTSKKCVQAIIEYYKELEGNVLVLTHLIETKELLLDEGVNADTYGHYTTSRKLGFDPSIREPEKFDIIIVEYVHQDVSTLPSKEVHVMNFRNSVFDSRYRGIAK